MTNLLLKERLERLGRTPGEPAITSGSSELVDLVSPDNDHLGGLRTISAIKSLARRGVRLPLAKALIEELVRRPPTRVVVRVPHVEDRTAFREEMSGNGVDIVFIADHLQNR